MILNLAGDKRTLDGFHLSPSLLLRRLHPVVVASKHTKKIANKGNLSSHI